MVVFRLNLNLVVDGDTTIDELTSLLGEWVQENDFDLGGTITRIGKRKEVDVEYIEIE